MIKNIFKILIITSIVILLPIVAGVILWNQLPEEIPSHWNISGEIDGWSSKPFAVFGLPLILCVIHWICVLATASDPKSVNHQKKALTLVFWITPVLSVLLGAITYSTALGNAVKVEVIMTIFIGLLFTVIGNYLPKCKQNYTIGFKLPWTLNSEENWNRTHRLAGRISVICGVAITLLGFFGFTWIMFISFIAITLIPTIYSYILFRKGI